MFAYCVALLFVFDSAFVACGLWWVWGCGLLLGGWLVS